MTPEKFHEQMKKMIKDMPDEDRIKIFNQDGLKALKRMFDGCEKSEKFAIVTNEVDYQSLRALIKYFKLSVYYKRSHTTIFLTNFDGFYFPRLRDDRYRFLKALYPKSKEYANLSEERQDFFKKVLK